MNSSKYYITKGNSMRGMVNELKSLRTDIQESTKSVYPMPYETIVEELNRIIKIAADVERATSKNQYSSLWRVNMNNNFKGAYDADVAKELEYLKNDVESTAFAYRMMNAKNAYDTVEHMVDWITELKNGILDSMNAPHPIPYEMIAHELNKIANCLTEILPQSKSSGDTHTNDPVHHPKHYELMPGVEVKDIIHVLGNKPSELTGWQEFCKGNVLKYMLRAEDKNGMEDYEKAAVYLGWLLEDYGEDR